MNVIYVAFGGPGASPVLAAEKQKSQYIAWEAVRLLHIV